MMGGFGTTGAFGGWWMLLGGMAGLAILVLLVWGVFSLAGTAQQQRRTDETALDILKKRYAAGEISPAEFELAKKGLDEGVAGPQAPEMIMAETAAPITRLNRLDNPRERLR